MSQREKDTLFFRMLLSCHGHTECQELRARINENQRNEKSVRRAVFLACVLGLASVSGLGYSALFHPEILQDPSHGLFRVFAVTGLASLICLVSFTLWWAHYRVVLDSLHDECRTFLLDTLPHQFSARRDLQIVPPVWYQDSRLAETQTFLAEDNPKLIALPRLS